MRHTMEVKNNREILFLERPLITVMVKEFPSSFWLLCSVIYWSDSSSSSKGGKAGGDSGSFPFIGEL